MQTPTHPVQNPQLSGNVLFYSKPEPLNREQHGRLALKQIERPFKFAAAAHVVPLTMTEFGPASLSYPIIFAGEARQPLAVMGVQAGENLFISPEGEVTPDAYLPAYIRRYPFVLADDSAAGRFIVCLDLPLFANGEPTDYTKGAIDFCNNFEAERRRTTEFVSLIQSLDLLETKQATYTPRMPDGSMGEQQLIAEYFAVSEDKLRALPNEKFLELRDNGALGQIYAHIVSILGWEKLYTKALIRRAAEQAAAPAPANLN
jgi:hypothetical protein